MALSVRVPFVRCSPKCQRNYSRDGHAPALRTQRGGAGSSLSLAQGHSRMQKVGGRSLRSRVSAQFGSPAD
eukprot:137968-Pyramimonas_sp.AAC.1